MLHDLARAACVVQKRAYSLNRHFGGSSYARECFESAIEVRRICGTIPSSLPSPPNHHCPTITIWNCCSQLVTGTAWLYWFSINFIVKFQLFVDMRHVFIRGVAAKWTCTLLYSWLWFAQGGEQPIEVQLILLRLRVCNVNAEPTKVPWTARIRPYVCRCLLQYLAVLAQQREIHLAKSYWNSANNRPSLTCVIILSNINPNPVCPLKIAFFAYFN